MKMKWLFLFAAVYVVLIAKVPDHCDVETFHQCSNEEIKIINDLELKTDEELNLLLEMESTETELVHKKYLEKLSNIMKELNIMEKKLDFLNDLYSEQTLMCHERLADLKVEYRSDLTRRILERGKSADGQSQL